MEAIPIIKTYVEYRDGEVRITGRNLKAELVARMHVDGEMSVDYVMEHYDLTRAEVHAALAFFYENRERLDAEYERDWEAGRKEGAIRSKDFEARIRARMEAMQQPEDEA